MSDPQNGVLAKSAAIAGVSLLLGLLFDYLLYGKIPGISFPIYVSLILIGLFALSKIFDKKIKREILWLIAPIVFFSSMVFVRDSVLLNLMNIGAASLLLLLIAGVSVDKSLKDFLIGDYILIFFLPFRFIVPLINTLIEVFSMRGVKKDKQVLAQIIKGIALSIPVLIVLMILFSSADLVFQKYVSDFLNLEITPETLFRTILVFIATLAYIGAYTFIMTEKEGPAVGDQRIQTSNLGRIEIAIVLGSINVLFFVFILVQLAYLFGGQANVSAQGFTYAEYARRGFFELIAVAIISLLLLLATERDVTKNEQDHKIGYKALSTVLVVQVIVIMVSAFTRLLLYERAYGFTTLRLYSHAFIIFLAVIFVSFLYKIYMDDRNNMFALRLFAAIALFVVAMNVLNPDAFIAQRNIERFRDTGRIDIRYLNSLSDDAVPDVIRVIDDLKPNFRLQLAILMSDRYKARQESRAFSTWQSTNLARVNASNLLKENQAKLRKYSVPKHQFR